MKLLVITPGLHLGGAERSLAKFLNVIEADYCSVLVVSLSGIDSIIREEIPKRIELRSLGGARSSSPLTSFKVLSIAVSYRPDVIMGWATFGNLLAAISSELMLRSKCILCERNYVPKAYSKERFSLIKRRLILSSMRLLYRRADVVTANSQKNLKFLRRWLGPRAEYRMMPNVVDVNANTVKANEGPIKIAWMNGTPKILALGRLVHQKGFDILLESFSIVLAKQPTWKLVVVGDGPFKDELLSISDRLGIAEAVEWIGRTENSFAWYVWADFVVVPSRFEGFPNVPLEAMSVGAAVLCSDCKSGPRELTLNGLYGGLYSVNDRAELGAKMLRMGADKEMRNRIASLAMSHVRRTYDVEVVRHTYRSILS